MSRSQNDGGDSSGHARHRRIGQKRGLRTSPTSISPVTLDLDPATWVWTLRENVTANEAACIARPEELEAAAVTCGAALSAAAGHRARIDLIE